MKERSYGTFRRFIAGFMAVLMVALLVPVTAAVADDNGVAKVADPSTANTWKDNLLGTNGTVSTENAGMVWVDKSVYASETAELPGVTLDDKDNNFLVALSALASNKEITGYSNLPTDTVLVLDVSGSMNGNYDELVAAANAAMTKLFATNNHNRVGLVLYASSSAVVLPLGRYTATNTVTVNGQRVSKFLQYNNGNNNNWYGSIYVADGVYYEGTSNKVSTNLGRQCGGGTYIQGGLADALEVFMGVKGNVDIPAGEIQAGVTRIPTVVLMSDGAPTYASETYAWVPDNYDCGNGNDTNDGIALLSQLTAAYLRGQLNKDTVTVDNVSYDFYGQTPLFYTLGLGVDDDEAAMSVLEPTGITEWWWSRYKMSNDEYNAKLLEEKANGTVLDDDDDPKTMHIWVPAGRSGSGNTKLVNIARNHPEIALEDRNYVTEYFSASSVSDLIASFQKIVDEIVVQSRYYPTQISGGNPDLDGYVTFTDYVGDYMEVKDIKGILLGDTLFDGEAMAKAIAGDDGTDSLLGSVSDPSELGDEFVHSVQARLKIWDLATARALIGDAYNDNQLGWDEENGVYSAYIGWYAYGDYVYHSFWDKDATSHPTGADAPTYAIRSYGFLGNVEGSGSFKETDMMYISVRVVTEIATGIQHVDFSVPAALVPMITYKITLNGDSYETATDISMEVDEADPIRLVYEAGLKSHINELNVAEIMAAETDAKYKDTQTGNYYFWTNDWDNKGTPDNVTDDTTTSVHFTPSASNEKYHFIEDTDVLFKDENGTYNDPSDDTYRSVGWVDALTSPMYYYRTYTFEKTGNSVRMIEVIHEIPQNSPLRSIARRRNNDAGTWYIPMGTAYQNDTYYTANKSSAPTNSLSYSKYTAIHHGTGADAHLGNNGRLTLTPAQGIAITKTLDVYEPFTNTDFAFEITLDVPDGTYPTVLADAGTYEGTDGTATVTDGVMTVTVPAGKTLYITGLPANTNYSVRELTNRNDDYKFVSVTVNGGTPSNDNLVNDSVSANVIDKLDYVNTPARTGDLIINKSVVHPFGDNYVMPEDIEFEFSVKLESTTDDVLGVTFDAVTEAGATEVTSDANGVITFTLGAGEAISIHDIPAGTVYTVTEKEVDGDGFTADTNNVTGTLEQDSNESVTITNTYSPAPADADVTVDVTKLLSGRKFKDTDKFTFVLDRVSTPVIAETVNVDKVTVDGVNDAEELKAEFSLADESYSTAGIYHYTVYEVNDAASANGILGMHYDATIFNFTVTVGDADMDGQLEITAVNGSAPTEVEETADGWLVSATVNNSYAPASGEIITIDIQKLMDGTMKDYASLAGFVFGLYNGDQLLEISEATNESGETSLELNITPDMAGSEYTYQVKEIIPETRIPGMTYTETPVTFTVKVVDNEDGTISTYINGAEEASTTVEAEFTNIYSPEEAAVQLGGIKVLEGDRDLGVGEFTFNLYETESDFDITDITPKTTTNGESGAFNFGNFTYETAGTKYYVITEAKGDLGGITYDETVYEVTVVIDDLGNGSLRAIATYDNGEETSHEAAFTNYYKADSVDVELMEGSKVLVDKDLEDGMFTFELKDEKGDVVDTKTNKDGKFKFDELTFDEAGEYEFTIVENSDDKLGGITYDDTVYTVVIKVTDPGDGQLVAGVSYFKGTETVEAVTFENSYAAESVDVTIDGTKILTGRELKYGEFKFKLTNVGTGETEEVVNGADGKFEFDTITFNKIGEYKYTVTEINNAAAGVGYDTSVYGVVITVTDNGEGKLEAAVEYLKNSEEAEAINFLNKYEQLTATVELTVNKTVENLSEQEIGADGFKFVLEADGKTVGEVTTDANGKAVFTLKYTDADLGKTFTYKMSEVNDGKIGMTYDSTVYEFVVTVGLDNDGKLVASVTKNGSTENALTADFTNTYRGVPKPGDMSNMLPWIAMLAICGCAVFGIAKKRERSSR